MSNRLSQETAPYFRQHADNPVDWYPWGEEALRQEAIGQAAGRLTARLSHNRSPIFRSEEKRNG